MDNYGIIDNEIELAVTNAIELLIEELELEQGIRIDDYEAPIIQKAKAYLTMAIKRVSMSEPELEEPEIGMEDIVLTNMDSFTEEDID